MKKFRVSFFLVIVSLLTGCLNVATTGAQAVYNRHRIEKNVSDQVATMQAYRALYLKNNQFQNANVSVATFNGEMLLAGQVPHEWQKKKAEAIASKIANVKKVYNFLELASRSSTLVGMSDTWITAKIKSKLVADNDIDATQIKVVTENGTVFLMGILPKDEADLAVNIAQETFGVQKVVKIFSYLKITKEA